MPTKSKKNESASVSRKAGRIDAAVRALIEDRQLPGTLLLTDRVLQLRHPEEGKIRMRKVVSRSKTRPTGKFPSRKNGRMNHWESPHELNAFRTLEADSTVLRFDEQPMEIVYLMDGVVRSHIPDIRVVRRCHTKEIWEVKTAEEARDPEVERRSSIMVAGLPTFGYRYRLVTSEQLEAGPALLNAQQLLPLGKGDISAIERETCRRLVLDRGEEFRWAELTRALGPRGKRVVSRLLLDGALHFDASQRLQDQTPISLPKAR